MSVFVGSRCPDCGGVEETVTDGQGNVLYIRDTCTCHGIDPHTPTGLYEECLRKEAERKQMNERYEHRLTEVITPNGG